MVVVNQCPKPLITLLLTTANLNIVRWEVTKPTSHSWMETFKITTLAAPTKLTPLTSQVACLRKEANNIIAYSNNIEVKEQVSITMALSRFRRKTISSAFLRLQVEISMLAAMEGWCTSQTISLEYSSRLATTYSTERKWGSEIL